MMTRALDSIFEYGHEGGAEGSRGGQGDEPGDEDVAEQQPVDVVVGAQATDEDDGSDFAVGGGDGEADVGGDEDR